MALSTLITTDNPSRRRCCPIHSNFIEARSGITAHHSYPAQVIGWRQSPMNKLLTKFMQNESGAAVHSIDDRCICGRRRNRAGSRVRVALIWVAVIGGALSTMLGPVSAATAVEGRADDMQLR